MPRELVVQLLLPGQQAKRSGEDVRCIQPVLRSLIPPLLCSPPLRLHRIDACFKTHPVH